MKKIIAGALLIVYLYNLGGPVVLHYYFSYLSEKYFTEQTSKGLYNVNDLTEVKISVNMPNIADWKAYENVRGQVKFADITYNYVKMKVTRTALYLMCVPDYATTHFSTQNIIEAKNVKNAPVQKKEHVRYAKNTLLKIINQLAAQFEFTTLFKNITEAIVPHTQCLASNFPDIPEQPPKLFV